MNENFFNKDFCETILTLMNISTFSFIIIKGLLSWYNNKKIKYLKIFCETYNHYENGISLYLNIVSEKPININNFYLTLNNQSFNSVRKILDNDIGIDYSRTSLDSIFDLFNSSFYLEPFIIYKKHLIFKDNDLKDFENIIKNLELNIDLLFTVKKIKFSKLIFNSLPLKNYLKEYFSSELKLNFEDVDDKDRGILSDL